MNIQIFGKSKCFDTKKAQRYFKERGVKIQFIDLGKKAMSRYLIPRAPAMTCSAIWPMRRISWKSSWRIPAC